MTTGLNIKPSDERQKRVTDAYREHHAAIFGKSAMERWLDEPDEMPAVEPPRKILRNRCRCRKCGDVIESRRRHDRVACKCGAIYTDGGREYLHRGGDMAAIEDLTEWEP